MIETGAKQDFDAVREASLHALPDIETLYVFGSRARGNARVDSDIDLAVLAKTPIDAARRFEAQREISALLDCDVDLIDLRNASTVLRSEVVNGGTPLFKRNAQETLAFEARVLSEYAALLDSTLDLREAIRQRGSIHA
ncbi:MAG TPA: nucleotidyltransferase domain-containing protein [Rhodanobacteraceae bacterium]